MSETLNERYPQLAPHFAEFDRQQDRLREAWRVMCGPASPQLYLADLYYTAAVKRSIDVTDGIGVLMRALNALAAAALVRLHLETLVRLAYVTEADNGEEVAGAVVRGADFGKLKDGTGKQQLRDRFLVDRLAARIPWVRTMYDATNEYVHFGDRALFHTVQRVGGEGPEDRTLKLLIGSGLPNWSAAETHEMLSGTVAVTNGILDYLGQWTARKQARAASAARQSSSLSADV